jgi:hypothetical protein
MTEERRRNPRIAIDVPARLTVGTQALDGRIQDICRDAVLVEAAQSFPTQTAMTVEAELPRVAGTVRASGTVIRLTPGRNGTHGMAVLFDEVPTPARLRIDLFLSEQEG